MDKLFVKMIVQINATESLGTMSIELIAMNYQQTLVEKLALIGQLLVSIARFA